MKWIDNRNCQGSSNVHSNQIVSSGQQCYPFHSHQSGGRCGGPMVLQVVMMVVLQMINMVLIQIAPPPQSLQGDVDMTNVLNSMANSEKHDTCEQFAHRFVVLSPKETE